jgi:hypothetical protein
MSRPSLLSCAMLLIFTCACVSHAGADPLADEISSAAAKWDAAINNADFDALLLLIPDEIAHDSEMKSPAIPI